jgi:hypothetical protein
MPGRRADLGQPAQFLHVLRGHLGVQFRQARGVVGLLDVEGARHLAA